MDCGDFGKLIYPRDAMLSRYLLSPRVCSSVCQSITSRYYITSSLAVADEPASYIIIVFCILTHEYPCTYIYAPEAFPYSVTDQY